MLTRRRCVPPCATSDTSWRASRTERASREGPDSRRAEGGRCHAAGARDRSAGHSPSPKSHRSPSLSLPFLRGAGRRREPYHDDPDGVRARTSSDISEESVPPRGRPVVIAVVWVVQRILADMNVAETSEGVFDAEFAFFLLSFSGCPYFNNGYPA